MTIKRIELNVSNVGVSQINKGNTDNNGRVKFYSREHFQQNKKENIEKKNNKRHHTKSTSKEIHNLKSKNSEALKGKSKTSSMVNILGTHIEKQIGFQKSPEMNCPNIEIIHVKPISIFKVSQDEGMREAVNSIYTQPSSKQMHQHKGTKSDFLAYRLEIKKIYHFLELNEEKFNKTFHR